MRGYTNELCDPDECFLHGVPALAKSTGIHLRCDRPTRYAILLQAAETKPMRIAPGETSPPLTLDNRNAANAVTVPSYVKVGSGSVSLIHQESGLLISR